MASSRMLALLGLLAVAGYQNRDKLQGILGNLTGQNPRLGNANDNEQGGLGGLLGGLFGGSNAGGGLSGAIGDLVGRFSDSGHGDTARSWIEAGPNREVPPRQLEEALGEDTLAELMQKTGLSRQELLSRLSTVLPAAVDKLTPEGRLPTPDEENRWARASA
jgi:uncharacterized protein YidB (DUF937 family)